jgi:hypothetical protein
MKLSQTALGAIGDSDQILLGKLRVLADAHTLKTLRKHGLVSGTKERGGLVSDYVTDKSRAVYRLDGYLPTPAVQEWLEGADLETGLMDLHYRTVQVRQACQTRGFVEYVPSAVCPSRTWGGPSRVWTGRTWT